LPSRLPCRASCPARTSYMNGAANRAWFVWFACCMLHVSVDHFPTPNGAHPRAHPPSQSRPRHQFKVIVPGLRIDLTAPPLRHRRHLISTPGLSTSPHKPQCDDRVNSPFALRRTIDRQSSSDALLLRNPPECPMSRPRRLRGVCATAICASLRPRRRPRP
jgi:hypothetical protein